MKKHGNTLYITSQGAYVSKDGENLVISIDKVPRLRLPIHTIEGVVSFGNVLWTPFALELCGLNGVTVSMMSESGRFLVRCTGSQSGNVLLRRAQHQASSNPDTISLAARSIVSGKLANTRSALLRMVRDHYKDGDAGNLRDTADFLAYSIRILLNPAPVEIVRGIEGDAARHYFAVFDQLILSQKTEFFMRTRSRRPPLDKMNALLSFIYTLLVHDVVSACESVGLDPQMGFLHADRSGRPSLALDLMEEFRPWLADRLALTLVNRNQISAKGFCTAENGSVKMNDETRRTVITAWKERKDDLLVHPFLNERMPIGILPFVQAQLMARWLRGGLDAYPPFFWK